MIQEGLHGDPWRILVASILVGRTRGVAVATRGVAVAGILPRLFDRYPARRDLAAADPGELAGLLRPLGLQNVRASGLVRLAAAMRRDDEDPKGLPGVGPYAYAAWRVFVRDDLDVNTDDRALAEHVARERGRRQEGAER